MMFIKYTLLLVVTFILNAVVSGEGPCDGYWLLDGDCPEHEGKVYFDDESKTCNTNVAYELNEAQHVNCFQEGHQFASIDECKQTCLGIGIPEITTEIPEVTTEAPPEVPEIPADVLENQSGIHGDTAGIPETPEISETLINNPEIPADILENLSGIHGSPSEIPENPAMLEISTKEIGTQTTENLQQSIQYLQLKIQKLQLKIQKIQFRIQNQLVA